MSLNLIRMHKESMAMLLIVSEHLRKAVFSLWKSMEEGVFGLDMGYGIL